MGAVVNFAGPVFTLPAVLIDGATYRVTLLVTSIGDVPEPPIDPFTLLPIPITDQVTFDFVYRDVESPIELSLILEG